MTHLLIFAIINGIIFCGHSNLVISILSTLAQIKSSLQLCLHKLIYTKHPLFIFLQSFLWPLKHKCRFFDPMNIAQSESRCHPRWQLIPVLSMSILHSLLIMLCLTLISQRAIFFFFSAVMVLNFGQLTSAGPTKRKKKFSVISTDWVTCNYSHGGKIFAYFICFSSVHLFHACWGFMFKSLW